MSNTVGLGGSLTLRFSIYWGTRATVFDLAGGDGSDIDTRVRR